MMRSRPRRPPRVGASSAPRPWGRSTRAASPPSRPAPPTPISTSWPARTAASGARPTAGRRGRTSPTTCPPPPWARSPWTRTTRTRSTSGPGKRTSRTTRVMGSASSRPPTAATPGSPWARATSRDARSRASSSIPRTPRASSRR